MSLYRQHRYRPVVEGRATHIEQPGADPGGLALWLPGCADRAGPGDAAGGRTWPSSRPTVTPRSRSAPPCRPCVAPRGCGRGPLTRRFSRPQAGTDTDLPRTYRFKTRAVSCGPSVVAQRVSAGPREERIRGDVPSSRFSAQSGMPSGVRVACARWFETRRAVVDMPQVASSQSPCLGVGRAGLSMPRGER